MMKTCYLFLILAVAAVSSTVIDINENVDTGLAKINEYLRRIKITSFPIPKGTFGFNVSFSESDVLGLDSLKRTDKCTLDVVYRNVTVDLHYGFGFFQHSFKSLKINGQDMSASYRIGDNSVRVHYTVHNIGRKGARCSVILHDLSIERLAKIDFHASRPEYDGIDLEAYFEKEIVSFLNKKIDKGVVERALQGFICNNQHMEISEHMPLIHHTILEQIGVPSYL